MKPPFFLVDRDDGSATTDETVELAAREVEPEDLPSGLFAIYDTEGRRFQLEVTKVGPFRFPRVIPTLDDHALVHAGELRDAIVESLAARDGMSVETLEWFSQAAGTLSPRLRPSRSIQAKVAHRSFSEGGPPPTER
jgi:hypothetical protein